MKEFRNYSADDDSVSRFYRENHAKQTLEFVLRVKSEVSACRKLRMSVTEAMGLLDEIVDDSDPDTRRPQVYHAIQVGEAARRRHPEPEWDWFHLVGFLHDLGKVMAHPRLYGLPQWAVVGDTFPLGCAFSDRNLYAEAFEANPDHHDARYRTACGIYQPHAGFENLTFSLSHDEYLYQVCRRNQCVIPPEGLYLIRFHSFYPWHQHQAYDHLASDHDRALLPLLREFQACDLYSKDDDQSADLKQHLPYYQALVRKYCPQELWDW